MRAAAYGAGVYVAVGDNGTIIHSAPFEAVLADPQIAETDFSVTVRIPPEESVVVETTPSLTEDAWKPLATIAGGETGKEERVTHSISDGQQFYRLRVQ